MIVDTGVGAASALGCAFAVALALSRRLARRPLAVLIDRPNERSLHSTPTPRSGGLAILAALVTACVVLGAAGMRWPGAGWLAGGAAIVVGVSFFDDLSHVNQLVRLALHLLAASLAVAGGLVPEEIALPGATIALGAGVGAAFAVLLVAWLVNAYNFMDGMDGFAAGMAVLGFGALAALGLRAGDPQFATAMACIAAAAGGFLVVNFPPARIFMGDVGSSLLGFLAGLALLSAEARGIAPLWVGVLAFSPFLVDATVTLARRVLRGEPFWRSHKSHYYQRVVELGWGHRRTVLAEYLLMLAAGVSAVVAPALAARSQAVLLASWALAYTMCAVAVGRAEISRRDDGPDTAG